MVCLNLFLLRECPNLIVVVVISLCISGCSQSFLLVYSIIGKYLSLSIRNQEKVPSCWRQGAGLQAGTFFKIFLRMFVPMHVYDTMTSVVYELKAVHHWVPHWLAVWLQGFCHYLQLGVHHCKETGSQTALQICSSSKIPGCQGLQRLYSFIRMSRQKSSMLRTEEAFYLQFTWHLKSSRWPIMFF